MCFCIMRLLLDACCLCRCRTVVRVQQPESQWNTLKLPVTSNAIGAQEWLMSPVYFFFQQCTCTKVGSAHGGVGAELAIRSALCCCSASDSTAVGVAHMCQKRALAG
jgi:hypothetical protein